MTMKVFLFKVYRCIGYGNVTEGAIPLNITDYTFKLSFFLLNPESSFRGYL